MPDGVRVDASDLRKVGKIARTFGPELNRQLRKNIRAAAAIGANDAKQAIREMPSKGQDDHKLRELIASAVSISIVTGKYADVRIRVRRTPALNAIGAGGIAKAINTGKWKHPVFGDREVWVAQKGFEFFDSRIERHREEMKVLVAAALDEAARIASERGIL
jgi:hypothetical protein